MENYKPVIGKTYSLFGKDASTQSFYEKISILTDELLDRFSYSEKQLLEYLQSASRSKARLRKNVKQSPDNSKLASLLHRGQEILSEYTGEIEQHLRSVLFYKHITDRRLLTSREQYYLYMIEFELVNRLHIRKFKKSNFRIALLPYCLRETQTKCKAIPDEIDYVCKGCLNICYINRVNSLLRENDVNPYIWKRAKLKNLFRELYAKHGSIGVLGIACMVELVWGMRLCMKVKIPVVGIPLNANRCARWMDGFYETSVDFSAIEKLISGDPSPK